MKYSVWNNSTRRYDYYVATGDTGIHAGAPPRASAFELGATPEQAAWPLPADATKTGSGEVPQGRIASTTPTARFDFPSSVVYAAIGYMIWRVLR